jgi:hypothetical protein
VVEQERLPTRSTGYMINDDNPAETAADDDHHEQVAGPADVSAIAQP